MTEFLVYDVKAAVLVAVFYLFYRLLLAHETLHRLNRLVLLGTAVVSMVLPLCVITVHHTVVVPAPAEAEVAAAAPVPMAGEVLEPLWLTLLCVVFFLGVVLVLTKTVLSVVRVCMLIKESELHPQPDGITLAVTSRDLAPFSWMHYIVLSRSDYASPDAAILAHERAHIRLRHSVDVLLVDVLTACQWFNPAMWLLRSDLRTIHEYEADAAVLSQGIDARQYQYLLVRKAVAAHGYSVANSLSHSTLKRRINMMTKKKTNSRQWLRALYIIPVVAASLAISARTVTDYRIADEQVPATPDGEAVDHSPSHKSQPSKLNALHSTQDETESKASDFLEVKEGDSIKIVYPGGVEHDKVTVATASNGKHPLVIVNGTEMPYDQFVKISPKIIKSITVLKDEDGRKKYGTKAKDGVILVEIEDHPNKKGHEPFKLKGLVIDEKKEPVVGAIVRVKGTKQGTVTDVDGQYTLEVPDGAVVEVAYVGMETASFTASKAIADTRTTAIVLKKDDGSDPMPTVRATVIADGKETRKIVTHVVVDNKEMTMEEFENTTEPEKIESINIDKTDPKHIKMKVTLKK